MKTLVLGTRRSRLALAQTEIVRACLAAAHSGLAVEVREFVTTGDRVLDRPIHEIGTKGLWTRELDAALLAGDIDAAVHSLKDLPAEMPEGVVLASVPERVEPFDCLLAPEPVTLATLPAGARLGTSSLRRRAQLREARPELAIVDVRGNLDTRWRKLEDGQFEVLVLALAGVRRLGWDERVREVLDASVCLPAPCQGALAVTARADDAATRERLAAIEDPAARLESDCERGFLEELAGGCSVPAGALARRAGSGRIELAAYLAGPDGASLRERGEAAEADPHGLGREVARRLLESGGRAWVEAAKGGGA